MEKLWAKLGEWLGYMIAVAILMLLFAFPLMWTWNYAIPHLFGLPELTWGQAWCLSYVVKGLFAPHHYGKG